MYGCKQILRGLMGWMAIWMVAGGLLLAPAWVGFALIEIMIGRYHGAIIALSPLALGICGLAYMARMEEEDKEESDRRRYGGYRARCVDD